VTTVVDDPKLTHAIETIIKGLIQPSRELKTDGKFTLKDLASLPPITPTYPDRKFTGIYVRFYTHTKDMESEDVGAYVSQSQLSLWGR